MRLLRGRAPLLGLDIGTSAIKAVGLCRSRRRFRLRNLAIQELPPGAVSEGAIRDTQVVAEALGRLLDQHHLRARQAAAAVAGNSVMVRHLPVPPLEQGELGPWAAQMAAQHLPFDSRDVLWSYQVFDSPRDGHGPTGERWMALAVARPERVAERTAVLEAAGCQPVVMDVEAFALANCFLANYAVSEDETVAVADIGASLTHVVILCGTTPVFSRDCTLGGRLCTEQLARELGTEWEQLAADTYTRGSSEQVASAVARFAELLVAELRRSLEFFSAGSRHVDRLLCTGGSVRLPGLLAHLERGLGVPVAPLDPLRRIAATAFPGVAELAPRFAVAIGLALRSFD
jgi:type IV pilus assembly protein PilM